MSSLAFIFSWYYIYTSYYTLNTGTLMEMTRTLLEEKKREFTVDIQKELRDRN